MNNTHNTLIERTGTRLLRRWGVSLGLLWLIVFCLYFYSFTLPNNPQFDRVHIWLEVPTLLGDFLFPPYSRDPVGHQSWTNLLERSELLLPAALILGGAWGIGSLLLRALRVDLRFTRPERIAIAGGLGLSAVSLFTLLTGLCGVFSRGLTVGVLLAGLVAELVLCWRNRSADKLESTAVLPRRWRRIGWCIAFPFVLVMLLGSMVPSFDFDVKEYHLQGPKEYLQDGRVHLLEHNVYTSFPFLTEMLTLTGMVVKEDWYLGALVGKVVLMSFALLTALAVYAAGARWFHPLAGGAAALIHLSTPWTYRISIIAYAEGGLTCYLFLTLLATLLTIEHIHRHPNESSLGSLLLCGLLAGSAMSCKYPGVLSVVIPLGLLIVSAPWLASRLFPETPREENAEPQRSRRQLAVRWGAVYSLGVFLAVGPWLVKNAVETGNPVYPLLYRVFPSEHWSPEMEAKWKAAHSPDHHQLSDLGVKFIDVTAKSDWLSPLLFGLVPLAFLVRKNRALILVCMIFLAWLFLTWWVLTHRIDRFWVPLIPVASLLAGIGVCWPMFRPETVTDSQQTLWRRAAITICSFAMLFNFAFATTSLCGPNLYLNSTWGARQIAESTTRGIQRLNQVYRSEPDQQMKVLCVGEAQVFDARFPLLYNTVFDESLFERWCSQHLPDTPGDQQPMRSEEEINAEFTSRGVTHVLVNWQEILRYRMTYGYTAFVTPDRFAALQQMGILKNAIPVSFREWDQLAPQEQQEVKTWARELITEEGGQRVLITTMLYPVTIEK